MARSSPIRNVKRFSPATSSTCMDQRPSAPAATCSSNQSGTSRVTVAPGGAVPTMSITLLRTVEPSSGKSIESVNGGGVDLGVWKGVTVGVGLVVGVGPIVGVGVGRGVGTGLTFGVGDGDDTGADGAVVGRSVGLSLEAAAETLGVGLEMTLAAPVARPNPSIQPSTSTLNRSAPMTAIQPILGSRLDEGRSRSAPPRTTPVRRGGDSSSDMASGGYATGRNAGTRRGPTRRHDTTYVTERWARKLCR